MSNLWKLGATLVLLIAPLYAVTWRVARVDTTVLLAEDGTALVTERYEIPVVPKYEELPRALKSFLPEFVSDGSFQVRLGRSHAAPFDRYYVDLLGVEVDGAAQSYSSHYHEGCLELSISIPHGRDRVLEIRYVVKDAVRFLADQDSLHWTVANQVGAVIPEVSSHIVLPADAKDTAVQVFVLGGGRTERLTPVVDGDIVSANTNDLGPAGTLVMDLVFPKGVLSEPGWLRRGWWTLCANPIVLLPLIVFGFAYWFWQKKSRNYMPGLSVAPRYEPPEGLTPAEVGALVDDRVDPRDITSTLLDLAVRGYVRLEEAAPHHGSAEPDYKIQLMKPHEAWGDLLPHEQTMMFHMFYGGQWTMLSSLRLRFYPIVQMMAGSILESLKDKGMYRVPPDAVHAYRMAGFGLIAVLVWLAGRLGAFSLAQGALPALVSIVISAAIVYLFSRKMTAKTFKGLRAHSQILGFQEFLRTVEGDRLDRLPAKSFQRLLPYAMALGLEHRWTRAFEGITIEQPEWYGSADSALFDSILLGVRLMQFETTARSTLLTRPRGAVTAIVERVPEKSSAASA